MVNLLAKIIVVLLWIQPVITRAESVLEYVGSLEIPKNTIINGTTVGGLSGITYDPDRKCYYAVSDSSQSGGHRFYTLKIAFDKNSKPEGVEIVSVTTLKTAKGNPLPFSDTESIVYYGGNSVWIANEGVKTDPWIRNFAVNNGKQINECELPVEFLFQPSPDDPKKSQRGGQPNQSLESLALSPDQKNLYAANELALIQDRLHDIFLIRIVQFGQAGSKWKPKATRTYRISPGGFFRSLSDMCSLDSKGTLLMLERSVSGFVLNSNAFSFFLYEVNFNEPDTTEVLGMNDLPIKELRPLSKKQIFDSTHIPECDNVEGMTLGPIINGRQSLVLVSDDNFSTKQATRLHVLLFPQKP